MKVLFVHGYSETSLGAYFDFPARLQAALPAIEEIALAAFNSLDDTVTIDDLADAMEVRVAALERSGWDVRDTAVIAHSTGALIVRAWILNRVHADPPRAIPSHLVTMAGANHGSTLAQMGKSLLGYVQKAFLDRILSVGANVLTDLDYGSDFLLRLNRSWMDAWNEGLLDRLFAFSMGGDSVGNDAALQIFWQTHEIASDNTVRISGANLNYTIIDVGHDANGPRVVATRPIRPVPHLVLTGYSHFGPQTGILGFVQPGDPALHAVAEALGVTDEGTYATMAAEWSQRLSTWMAADRAAHGGNPHASLIKSTALFTIRDESGRSIEDCVIAFLDATAPGATDPTAIAARVTAANNVSASIVNHSPIQNNVEKGSYSFYIDYDAYVATPSHLFHIEAATPSTLVLFKPVQFTQPANLPHALSPNEFTYVDLTLQRDTSQTYAVYEFGGVDLSTSWNPMPFPPAGQIP